MFSKIFVKNLFLSATLMGVFTTSCNKSDDSDESTKTNYTISATADGAQEVPSVTTNGTGTVSGSYNSSTNLLNYTVTWKDLSGPARNMHFHGPAAVGVPAGVTLPITGFDTTAMGTLTGSATLTDAQETDLLGGKWYYNVHTDAHQGGEIRGQVSVH